MEIVDKPQESPAATAISSDAGHELKVSCAREVNDEASSGTGITPNGQSEFIAEGAAETNIRMERIKAIQSALAAGTYNVTSSDVAAKLITRLLKD